MPREPQTESYNRKDPSVSASQTFPSYKRVLLYLPCCNILRAFLCLHCLVVAAADRNPLCTQCMCLAWHVSSLTLVVNGIIPSLVFCYCFSSPRGIPTEHAKYCLGLSEVVKAFLS